MNQLYQLELTKEEIQAIQDYTGYEHAKINAIADLHYRKLNKLDKVGWNMRMTTEELENTILKFMNIYTAIYKVGNKNSSGRLYRGTNQAEINQIENREKINSILSTSYEEETAKTFTPYGNDATILRLRTQKDLPYLYVEPYKEEEKKDEEEILILPFSKVKNLEHTSNWNGYSYYDAILEKEELKEVPKQELETLKARLMEGYKSYTEQAKECLELEDHIEYIYMQLGQKNLRKEDIKYFFEQLNEKSNRFLDLRKQVDQYEEQFSKMLKGMCKERELEVDRQKEEKENQIKEQQNNRKIQEMKQLKAEISILKKGIADGGEYILDTLERYVKKIEDNSNKYQNIAEDLKIDYSMNPHFRTLENIQDIKRMIEKDIIKRKQKEKEEQENKNNGVEQGEDRISLQNEYQELLKKKQQLLEVKQKMEHFPTYIKEHDRQSLQQIKINLNQKIQDMITNIKMDHLQMERQQILQEKESKIQRLLYRSSLKEEKIANINAKIELAKRQHVTRNSENSIRIMMTNLYGCALEDLGGQFLPEMEEVLNAIRRNFGNLPSEEMLLQQAYQQQNVNYPTIIGGERMSKKKQIAFYRQDTERIKAEIYNTAYRENRTNGQNPTMEGITQFEQSISSIKNLLESDYDKTYSIDKEPMWHVK